MARLRTPPEIVSLAEDENRGYNPGSRTGLEKSHATIICWEKRLAIKQRTGPPAPAEILQLKEMKCILRGREPSPVTGWTINFLEQLLPASEYSRDYGYRKV